MKSDAGRASKKTALGILVLLLVAAAVAAQEPEPEPGTPDTGQARDYVIGPGDLLSIVVYGADDLSREVRVSATGFILVPLIPQPVRADGLTAEELSGALAREFEQREILRHPQITVLIREYKSRPVAILGAVRRPQMYAVIGPSNLMQVLSAAGGLSDQAGNLIYVTRGAGLRKLPDIPQQVKEPEAPGPRTTVVQVRDLLEARDPAANLPIYAGDSVTVPRAGIVYVVGAVNKPGGFMLRDRQERLTVLQAIALAQNITGTARPGDALIIRRPPETDEAESIEIDIGKIMARQSPDPVLQENDILFVPDSPVKKGLRRAVEAAIQITTGLVVFRR
ncbi:MAG: polysaccharide biosynthesis/export family protein [Terriglobia bacterium]